MDISPFLIEKIAAEVFWEHVHKHGMENTGFPTTPDEIPSSMWSLPIAQEKLRVLGYQDIDSCEIVYQAVANVIAAHGVRQQNIIGPIYIEDFEECKEKEFQYTEFINQLVGDADINCGYKILKEGPFFSSGTLLLRTPFPSGILLQQNPSAQNCGFFIPNTTPALGFQKTMIFTPDGIQPLPTNPQGYKFFLTGIFHILTKQPTDIIWYKIIPNSVGVLKSATFSSKKEKCSLTVTIT